MSLSREEHFAYITDAIRTLLGGLKVTEIRCQEYKTLKLDYDYLSITYSLSTAVYSDAEFARFL